MQLVLGCQGHQLCSYRIALDTQQLDLVMSTRALAVVALASKKVFATLLRLVVVATAQPTPHDRPMRPAWTITMRVMVVRLLHTLPATTFTPLATVVGTRVRTFLRPTLLSTTITMRATDVGSSLRPTLLSTITMRVTDVGTRARSSHRPTPLSTTITMLVTDVGTRVQPSFRSTLPVTTSRRRTTVGAHHVHQARLRILIPPITIWIAIAAGIQGSKIDVVSLICIRQRESRSCANVSLICIRQRDSRNWNLSLNQLCNRLSSILHKNI